MDKKENRIAVIGPAQSGKTCLAIGLFSTSTKGFTIEHVDQDGRAYLDDLKAFLSQGKWPAATNLGTNKNLRFDFCKEGKAPIRVSFPEFSGELLGSDEDFNAFANANFRDLEGAVLLVNPGADAFQSGDPLMLADTMAQYKRVISFLRDPNNGSGNAFVALTITAADRLKCDLVGKLEAFNQSVTELSNSLRTSGLKWKRFEVTITGQLDAQDNPKLAIGGKNSASAPFLWLLDALNWRPSRERLLKKIRTAAIALTLFAIGAGVWCVVDASNEKAEIDSCADKCKKAAQSCFDNTKPKDKDLKDASNALASIRELQVRWQKQYAATTAANLDPIVWRAYNNAIRRAESEIAENPKSEGSADNCSAVDNRFESFRPSTDAAREEWEHLKNEWNVKKNEFQEQFATAQLLSNIRQPLAENQDKHGREFIEFAAGLYGKLVATSPRHAETLTLKDEISSELDSRTIKEWREFAIHDFDLNAKSNASRETTRGFVALLEAWNPATSTGVVAKVELLTSVSNSIPRWRTAYETTQFLNTMEDAVKGRSLEKLAKLYPPRVETNEYLTVEFVEKQWHEQGEKTFAELRTEFLDGIVKGVLRRGGRPTLSDEDKKTVTLNAGLVGEPFSESEAMKDVTNLVQEREREWEKECKGIALKWIGDNVNNEQKRRGQGSLFDRYDAFDRNNKDNPFVKELVLPSVYSQVEKWLTADIESFKSLSCNNSDYSKVAEECYEKFKGLCREVFSRNSRAIEFEKSWAGYFAVACDRDGHLIAIDKCFPQKFVITQVEGMIEYSDFRNTYKGTDLTATITITPVSSDVKSYGLVSNQTLREENNHTWSPLRFDTGAVQIHPFDIIKINLKATDKITIGRNLECDVSGIVDVHGAMFKDIVTDSIIVGGMFDLIKATKYVGKEGWWHGKLTTNDTKPIARIKIYGQIEGKSIDDYVSDAKKKVEIANKEDMKAQ